MPVMTRPTWGRQGRAGDYLVIGIDEREPTGSTIYNTLLYFAPEGVLWASTAS